METHPNTGSETNVSVCSLYFSPFRTHDGRKAEEFVRDFVNSGEDREKSHQALCKAAEAEIELQIEYRRPQFGRVTPPDVAARLHLEKSYDAALAKLSRSEERLRAHDQDTHPNVKRDLVIHTILYVLIAALVGTVIFAKWFDVALPEMPWWFGWALAPLALASTALLPRFCKELNECWQRRFRVWMLGSGIAIMVVSLVLLAAGREEGAHRMDQYSAGITEQQLFGSPEQTAPVVVSSSNRLWEKLTYILLGVAEFFIAGGLLLCIKRDLEVREARKMLSEKVRLDRDEKDAIYAEWARVNAEIERREGFERQASYWKTQEMSRLEQMFNREWTLKETEAEDILRRIRRLSGDGRARAEMSPGESPV